MKRNNIKDNKKDNIKDFWWEKNIKDDRSKSADIVKKKDAYQVFDRLYTVKIKEVTPEKKDNRSKSPRTSINYLKDNKNMNQTKKSAEKKKEDV